MLPLVLPLGLPPCVLHVLHVLQIPRDRLWTWIQDEGTTESSDEDESEEESEEDAEEAAEAEEEEDEEGSDAAIVKDEDEPSLAQRAPRSTHPEVVARMAAKGTPVKAKPEAKPEARPEPEELSKKKKEKTKSPPKKKSKGKKVEEKPKHVRYAVEGEPHRTMPTGATRGEKYQAGAAYDNDVQVMQRTLESEYEVSLGGVCQHYKVCLAEETQARRELGLALLLVTDVRAYSVQMVLRCGTKNAQSTAAAEVCEKTCMAWSAWYAHPWATTSRTLHTTRVHGNPRCRRAACRLLCGEFAASTIVRIYFITPRVGGRPRGRPPSTLAFLADGSDTRGTAETK